MNAVLKYVTLVAALALSTIHSPAESVAFSTQVKDSPTRHQDKTESEPDYKINHCFNIGNRDGYRDHKKNERREHHPKCLSSEAFESYMSGYQEGFGGERSYRRDHRLSSWARVRTAHCPCWSQNGEAHQSHTAPARQVRLPAARH